MLDISKPTGNQTLDYTHKNAQNLSSFSNNKDNTPNKTNIRITTNFDAIQPEIREKLTELELFNGKELSSVFDHFKKIVQVSHTFEHNLNSKGMVDKSKVDMSIIHRICDNLDTEKSRLFVKTWAFNKNDYVSWDQFVARIKSISYQYLKDRSQKFIDSINNSSLYKGKVTYDQIKSL